MFVVLIINLSFKNVKPPDYQEALCQQLYRIGLNQFKNYILSVFKNVVSYQPLCFITDTIHQLNLTAVDKRMLTYWLTESKMLRFLCQ